MWPGLKAHWRTRETSPETTFDQGRIMGGGSTVMGMIALRGTPADYDEWAELGAAGWGWSEVLPYFRKLETDFDFHGDLHGDSGPIPIRRTAGAVAAVVARRRSIRARESDAAHRRHERRFPRRPWLAADEQHAGAPRLDRDELSRCQRPRPQEPHDHDRRDRHRVFVRGTARQRRLGGCRWRQPEFPRRRNRALRRRHSFAGLSVARRRRPGGGTARARDRRRRRPAWRGPQSAEPSAALHRRTFAPRRAAAKDAAPASDDLLAIFVRDAGDAAERHVHRRA